MRVTSASSLLDRDCLRLHPRSFMFWMGYSLRIFTERCLHLLHVPSSSLGSSAVAAGNEALPSSAACIALMLRLLTVLLPSEGPKGALPRPPSVPSPWLRRCEPQSFAYSIFLSQVIEVDFEISVRHTWSMDTSTLLGLPFAYGTAAKFGDIRASAEVLPLVFFFGAMWCVEMNHGCAPKTIGGKYYLG